MLLVGNLINTIMCGWADFLKVVEWRPSTNEDASCKLGNFVHFVDADYSMYLFV